MQDRRMWLFAVVAVLVSVLNRTEGARISLPNPDAGDREGRHWLVYRQVIPDSLDLGKRAASDAYMCGTLDVCFCGPVGIAGDICPKHDKSVTFHLRLHDPEVLGVASAQQVFAHHHHLHSPESSGVEAGVVATGIVPRAVRHLASRAAGASESSQAGVHSDSGFIAVDMTLSSQIRIWEDEHVEAPLAVVLLSSQPPVRAPSEPEAAADTKTDPQGTRGAMDLAAEAHAPLAMVKVWLGEEELMSESIDKACGSKYSTLHLGQPAVLDMCVHLEHPCALQAATPAAAACAAGHVGRRAIGAGRHGMERCYALDQECRRVAALALSLCSEGRSNGGRKGAQF